MPAQFENILVISQENIGDVIMSTAAVKLLREQYPSARITMMTSRECCEIMRDGVVINETIADAVPKGTLARQFYKLRTIWRLRKKRYDACYFLGHPRRRIVQLCKYAGIPVRVVGSHTLSGARNASPRRFATHIVPVTAPIFRHVVDYYQDIVQGYNCNGQRHTPFMHVPEYSAAPSQIAHKAATKVAFCFFGKDGNTHRWLAEYFDALIRKLAEKRIYMFAAVPPGEYNRVTELVARQKWPVDVFSTASLGECAACLRHADLLVAVNTGQTHMAAALNVPVVSISGKDAIRTYPYSSTGVAVSLVENCPRCRLDANCRIKARRDSRDYLPACIKKLTPDKLYPVIEQMLAGEMPRNRVFLV